ncbi:MAG: ABC transporter ATP-binding protein [Armatimonadota bacterium]|nr:ABC transporter ATP-binding protein [Armatimonadota bacterium]
MTVLEVRNLSKRFGGVFAVTDVHLHVQKGELLGLFGPNGAGKTTLFNLISGTLKPDSGEIFFFGEKITYLPPHVRARKGIARTFQIVQPFGELTVLDNVLVPLAQQELTRLLPLRPYDSLARRKQAMEILELVGLAAWAHERARNLPLGLLKLLEVARSLALQPKLLLLDEPLAGLHLQESEQLLDVLLSLRGQVTMVLVEHNVRMALPVCDRAVVMDAGRVIAEGNPEQVRRDPQVIQAYLGEREDA